jgi:hypothetical protein
MGDEIKIPLGKIMLHKLRRLILTFEKGLSKCY